MSRQSREGRQRWRRRQLETYKEALKVRCRFCRAKPGEDCHTGYELIPRFPHAERKEDALKEKMIYAS
jgi:hypothetical protein